jgi:VWFA-related protein
MKLRLVVWSICASALTVFASGQLPKPGAELPPPQPGQLGAPPEQSDQQQGNRKIEAPATFDTGTVVFKGSVRNVVVPTSVYDPDKKGYINGLGVDDFEVLDNDKPQKVSAELTEVPVSVVLVVQANSDVAPLLPDLKRAGLLLQGLVTGQEGDAAILAFDYRKTVLQDFTNDASKLDDAMHKLTAGASTAAVNDAVLYADGMLKRHDPQNSRRRVIILMSRDMDKGSETKLTEAIHQIQFDNVFVYSIDMSKLKTSFFKKPDYPRPANGGVPPEALPNVRGQVASPNDVSQQQTGNVLTVIPAAIGGIRDLFKKTPGEAFANFTGGLVFAFYNTRGLEQAITAIGTDLNSQYVLSYDPNNITEPGFHTIKVVVKRPGLQVRTRPGYWWGGGQQ